MSLIYWDTNLFQYWLDDSGPLSAKVTRIYQQMERRGDVLCSSLVTLGELLVLPNQQGDLLQVENIVNLFHSEAVRLLPFDINAARLFGRIRATTKAKALDAAHLACAGAVGVDLFITNDRALQKLIVPGIQFIDSLDTTALGPRE